MYFRERGKSLFFILTAFSLNYGYGHRWLLITKIALIVSAVIIMCDIEFSKIVLEAKVYYITTLNHRCIYNKRIKEEYKIYI